MMAIAVLAALALPTSLGRQRRPVALVWDVDQSSGVRLPGGIINAPAPGVGGRGNGGPGTGHGCAANIYGNQGAFPGPRSNNGAIPQVGNLTAHLVDFETKLRLLVPDAGFDGVCLLDFETMRAVSSYATVASWPPKTPPICCWARQG
jgi:hypothetical protein|eukprot:COSAG01_NODE_10562_length_2132_cov_1.893261_1_plen_148_part_00